MFDTLSASHYNVSMSLNGNFLLSMDSRFIPVLSCDTCLSCFSLRGRMEAKQGNISPDVSVTQCLSLATMELGEAR